MNLGLLLRRNALYRPDHTAIVCDGQRLTFNQLERRVNRLSNALLSLGLTKGDKLALILPNCIELLDAYWAAAVTGIVVVPLSPLLRGPGLVSLLNDSDSTAVLTCGAMVPELNNIKGELTAVSRDRFIVTDAATGDGYRSYEDFTSAASDDPPPAVEIADDDVYNIIYSSGTT
jgi:acyl-CoA synthetase (AMP-forming)/AMP-acid ligase II